MKEPKKTFCKDCALPKVPKEVEVLLPIYEEELEVSIKVCMDCNLILGIPHSSVDKVKKYLKDRRLV